VVQSTCVPTVIGDDVPKILRAAESAAGVPLIYSNSASNQQVDVGRLMLERVRAEDGYGKEAKISNSVNLVGFPEGEALAGLCSALERSGVHVNACVMPALSLEQARRLPRAAASVFLPNSAYEPVYDAVFRTPADRGHAFAAPYGIEGTRRWLASVAGLFGFEGAAEGVFAAEFAPLKERWLDLRASAAGRRVAFVADRESSARLIEPARFWGVPALRMLREMGLRVDVLMFGAEDRGALKGFKTREELERLLREGTFDAVYSEYFFDERLSRAGKARFGLSVFEPGLRGALESLERLLALGRWGFYRRYAAAFREVRP
jgi:hypothetical protein